MAIYDWHDMTMKNLLLFGDDTQTTSSPTSSLHPDNSTQTSDNRRIEIWSLHDNSLVDLSPRNSFDCLFLLQFLNINHSLSLLLRESYTKNHRYPIMHINSHNCQRVIAPNRGMKSTQIVISISDGFFESRSIEWWRYGRICTCGLEGVDVIKAIITELDSIGW